ncbi:MAG: hypothetical protein K8J09_19675, partial [Planctomycetes bacterium]|nr:hypothetical protein [Planctomycetota bacterium]
MRLIEGLDALRALDLAAIYGDASPSHSVVAVGVFDGVHLGHQRLLHELLEMSSVLHGLPTVVTFNNHPDQVLRGEAPPQLISVPHRLRLLRRAGVQRLVLLDFEPRLQNMTPREFATDVLLGCLHTRGLLLGYDSALGKDRAGTPDCFRQLGAELGFEVRVGARFELDGTTVPMAPGKRPPARLPDGERGAAAVRAAAERRLRGRRHPRRPDLPGGRQPRRAADLRRRPAGRRHTLARSASARLPRRPLW